MAKYTEKVGATGKKYTIYDNHIKVTYRDGSERIVRPTDMSYNVTKEAMEKDIADRNFLGIGNKKSNINAANALGEGKTDGLVSMAGKTAVDTAIQKENAIADRTKSMVNLEQLVQDAKKNNNIGDAISYGAESGWEGVKSGLNTAQLGARYIVADKIGMDDTADELENKLHLAEQNAVKNQQEIASKYNTNFGGVADKVQGVTNAAVGMGPALAAGLIATAITKNPAIGVNAARVIKGVPLAETMVQAGGNAINKAIGDGATTDEALQYGGAKAVAEGIPEYLFKGIKYMPGVVDIGEKLAGKVANETVKKATRFAGNMAGEGIEEGLVEIADPFLQNATYSEGEKVDWNAVLENAMLGALTGGVMNAGITGIEKGVNALPNAEKVQQNDQNRAFEALHGQKMGQNLTNTIQKPQNATGQAIVDDVIKNITNPNKVAQNQSSQAENQRISLEMSERTFENVKDKNILAYQQEHPEVKPYQQDVASRLLYDLQMGDKGRREVGFDPETRNVTTMHGISRSQSEPINRMRDDGLSYDQIEDGLNRIIEDEGSENTTNAKRVELYVHEAMQNGYNSITSGRVDRNNNYAISKMSLEELEAESERLSEQLSNTTDEFRLEEISAQLENIDKRREQLRNSNAESENLNQEVKNLNQEVKSTVDYATIQENPSVQYIDYDINLLDEEVRDFYEQIGELGEMASFKVRIVQNLENDANGMYDGHGNILISAKAAGSIESIRKVASHEIYHHMKNTDEHKQLQDLAFELEQLKNPNITMEQFVQNKIDDYYHRSKGKVQLDKDGAWDEIGAELVDRMLTDKKLAEQIWTEMPTLAQRIVRAIEDLLRRYKNRKLSAIERQEAELLRQARDMYMNGLQSMKYAQQSMGESRYMFAGELSRTADREALARAKQMEANGADMESIRQATGWFKSKVTGNKWAYEIDDSNASYTFMGDLNRLKNDPEYAEYMQMERNLSNLDFDANPELEKRYEYLFRKYAGTSRSNRGKASDFVSHDALFEAYPQLADMNWYQKDMGSTDGSYTPRVESLDMNGFVQMNKYAKDPVKTSLHEMQHAIQEIEGFPNGSNPQYWDEMNKIYLRTRSPEVTRLAKEKSDVFREFPYELQNLIRLQNDEKKAGNYDESSAYYEQIEEFVARHPEYADLWDKYEDVDWDLFGALRDLESQSADELYQNTAGEIMARDTAQRRNLNAEQRKQKQPAMGDENTVYADGGSGYSLSQNVIVKNTPKESDMPRIKEEYKNSVDEKMLDFIEDARINKDIEEYHRMFRVTEDEARDILKLTGIDVSGFKRSIPSHAIRHIDKDHGANGVSDHSMADENDIARMEYVIKNYDSIEFAGMSDGWETDKNNNPVPLVKYAKRVNGMYYVVETVPDTKRKTLVIKSAYKSKKEALYRPDAKPQANVRNDRTATSFVNNSISQNQREVNGDNHKEQQLTIIQNSNAMQDDYHTGIRSVDDILTFEEAIQEDMFAPDYTEKDAQNALRKGKITVYSSYPISQGVFVTPSKMEAQNYAGNGKVYSKTIALDDVAWIDSMEGQYAKVDGSTRYSMDAVGSQEYKDLLDEHGAMPEGENPTGENYRVEVPRSTVKGNKVRQFVRNIMEAPTIDHAVANMTAEELINGTSGDLVYEPLANQTILDAANERIARKGWEAEYEDLHGRVVSNDRITAEDIALGTRLIQEAQKAGDHKTAAKIVTDLAVAGTELGQSVQAYKLLKRLTPEGQLLALKRTQERINKGLEKQGKKPVSEISEETMVEFLEARSEGKRSEIWNREIARMGQETQGTWTDKLNALRYAAMLSNPKTHVRNIIGNVAMSIARQPTIAISAALEDVRSVTSKQNGVAPEQYRSLYNKTGQKYSKLREYAEVNYKSFAKEVLQSSGSRYQDVPGAFANNQRVFGDSLAGRVLEQVAGKGKYSVQSALEGEDMWFKHRVYVSALAGYMKANGITTKDAALRRVKNNGASIEKGEKYALEQAKKATFTEDNRVANKIGELENMNPISQVIVGGAMPFKRTPMNILTRGIEYSPAGIGMTGYKLVHAMKGTKNKWFGDKSGYNMNDVFESFAANMTGSAILFLGYKLAQAGFLQGSSSEDEERKSRYDQQMGSQEYAIVDPETGESWAIDWLAPAAMPLFAGAEVYNQVLAKNENAADPDYDNMIVSALGRISEPVFEMSCMQGVSDALASYSSGGTEFMSSVGKTITTGYAGQFIPQPLSAWAKTIDDTVRSSYASKESDFPVVGKTGEQFVKQQKSKIPVVSQQNEPSIDVWGNERKREFAGNETEQIVKRAINNFINPATYSTDKRTELDKELEQLYKDTDGNASVLPKSAENYVKVGDKTYHKTSEEKTAYDKTRGQKSQKYVSDFVNSSAYKSMSSTTKAKIIEELYDLADYEAKKEMLSNRNIAYSDSDYEKVLESNIEPSTYYVLTNTMKNYTGDGKKDKKKAYLQDQKKAGKINDEQYWYLYMTNAANNNPSKADLANCPYDWIKAKYK